MIRLSWINVICFFYYGRMTNNRKTILLTSDGERETTISLRYFHQDRQLWHRLKHNCFYLTPCFLPSHLHHFSALLSWGQLSCHSAPPAGEDGELRENRVRSMATQLLAKFEENSSMAKSTSKVRDRFKTHIRVDVAEFIYHVGTHGYPLVSSDQQLDLLIWAREIIKRLN